MSDSEGGRQLENEGGVIGAVSFGDNASTSGVTVNTGAIVHENAEQIADLIEQLKASLATIPLPDYEKRDAQSNVEQLQQELQKPESEERQSGIAHWVKRLADGLKDSGAIDLVKSLAPLLSVVI